MSMMHMVINNGELVFVSRDFGAVSAKCEELKHAAFLETADEMGVDIDDATEDDISEVEIQMGIEGDYYYTHSVDMPSEYSESDCFYTDEGDEFTYEELMNALEEYE